MKTIITTSTFVIALVTIGLIGINNNNNINNSNNIGNAFAQMDPDGSLMMEDMEMDDEGMMMSNQSEGMKMMNFNGTIDVGTTIAEAFKSKITTDIIGAIKAAQTNVGANSFVKEAELTPAHGYLVYKITVVDENMKKYKVIVDPGNGQVLMKKEITWCDYDHEKMKYGEEKYDKYSGHNNEYAQKKMMMKDKEY
jgi:Peptidase propeptide and YPEB domain